MVTITNIFVRSFSRKRHFGMRIPGTHCGTACDGFPPLTPLHNSLSGHYELFEETIRAKREISHLNCLSPEGEFSAKVAPDGRCGGTIFENGRK